MWMKNKRKIFLGELFLHHIRSPFPSGNNFLTQV